MVEGGRIAGVAVRFLVGAAALETKPSGADDGRTAALLAARGEGSSDTVSGSAMTWWSGFSFSMVLSSPALTVAFRWAARFFGGGFDAGVDNLSSVAFALFGGGSITGVKLESLGGGMGVKDCLAFSDSASLANGSSLFGGKDKVDVDLRSDGEVPTVEELGTDAGR